MIIRILKYIFDWNVIEVSIMQSVHCPTGSILSAITLNMNLQVFPFFNIDNRGKVKIKWNGEYEFMFKYLFNACSCWIYNIQCKRISYTHTYRKIVEHPKLMHLSPRCCTPDCNNPVAPQCYHHIFIIS